MANVGGIAADRLKSFIVRIERLSEERQALSTDISEVYAEAKATGFDVATMREIVKLRKLDKSEREEKEHLLELYKRALDMMEPELPFKLEVASAMVEKGVKAQSAKTAKPAPKKKKVKPQVKAGPETPKGPKMAGALPDKPPRKKAQAEERPSA